MSYFKNFPPALYKFGDEQSFALTTNLSQYVDLIDQVKVNDIFLQDYFIPANERPDQVSFKIYGTTDHYWTLFLANDHIRENGWPLTLHEVDTAAIKRYPHRQVTVKIKQQDVVDYYDDDNKPIFRTKLVGTSPDQFQIGSKVTGNVSGTQGIILKRDLSLGTFIIDTINVSNLSEISEQVVVPNGNGIVVLERTDVNEAETFDLPLQWVLLKDDVPVNVTKTLDPFKRKATISGIPFSPTSVYKLSYWLSTKNLTDGKFTANEELSYRNPDGFDTSMIVESDVEQYKGTHHYEDATGAWVDIDPLSQTIPSGAVKVTFLDNLRKNNEKLRQIKVLKPASIKGLVNEFAKVMSE